MDDVALHSVSLMNITDITTVRRLTYNVMVYVEDLRCYVYLA